MNIICSIHKQDVLECSNYRGIFYVAPFIDYFLTYYSTDWLYIFITSLVIYTNNKERSTMEHIFNFRQIMQKSREFDFIAHLLFIDFIMAYDSRKLLVESMREFNVPEKPIKLVIITLCETKLRVSS